MADYPPQLYVTHGGKYYINAFSSSGGNGGGGNGGGGGANPFYQILGRKKLTSAGDTIDVGGASVTTNVAVFDGSNVTSHSQQSLIKCNKLVVFQFGFDQKILVAQAMILFLIILT